MTHKPLAQLTDGEAEELGILGLTAHEFAHFTGTFVHQLFGHIYRTGDTWKSPPSRVPLKNIDLIRHLAGTRVVGTRCGEQDRRLVTRLLAFDIDKRPDDPNWDRIAALSSALGPPLLFQSSLSGGRHAYYFLDQQVDLLALADWRDPWADTLVGNVLRKIGMPVQDGFLEVYPQGTLRFAQRGTKGSNGRAFRLPFGPSSILLDPLDCFTPLAKTPQDSLRLFHAERLDLVYGQLDVEALRKAGEGAPPPEPKPVPAKRSRVKRSEVEPTDATGDALPIRGVSLAQGLTGPGQTNSALMTAALYFAQTSANLEGLVVNVLEWFDTHHNGHSRTLNDRGWGAVAAEAEECAEWAWERRSFGPRVGLSDSEVARNHVLALAMTSGPNATLDQRDLFRLELLMAEIVRHAKQWVVRRCVQHIASAGFSRREQVLDERVVFDELTKASRDFWPTPRAPLFVVPMPWALRVRFDGFSAPVMSRLFLALQDHGFVTLVHRASAAQEVAARYLVQLDFSVALGEPSRMLDLPAQIGLIFAPEEVRRDFSIRQRRRIRLAALDTTTRLFGDDASLVLAALAAGACWTCAVAQVRERTDAALATAVRAA
ncbi:MAG: hypothetical protein P3A27_05080 [Gemmatimonadota bacterium]|nr:hypothetical protein [Gemmatimonadota bacterium]